MVREKEPASSAEVRARRGRTLWLDCQAGVAGDMLVAALLDLAEDVEAAECAVRIALGSMPVEGFSIEIGRVSKAGISCLDFSVVLDEAHENHDHDMNYLHGCGDGRVHSHGGHHGHGHVHRNLADIDGLIDGADLTPSARAFAHRAFEILAEAEAEAHGLPVDRVHFHEVGAVDSIADIVAAAVLVDLLGIDRVIAPVLVEGCGTVRCRHGVMPVPVPATLGVCRAHGLPLSRCEVEGELVTPTGAALVAALSPEFELPGRYVVSRMGIGAGKRSYARPSILRAAFIEPLDATVGTAPDPVSPRVAAAPLSRETRPPTSVCKLECDLDDMTPEQMAFAAERLCEAGARDVHWVPVFTKKGRPAYELQVLCAPDETVGVENVIFRETSALGVRRVLMERTVLPRRFETRETAYGPITVKVAALPDGTERVAPEYEDCAAAAVAAGVPLSDVMDAAFR